MTANTGWAAFLLGALFVSAIPAGAQTGITAGSLVLASTFESISVRAGYSGDTNANGSASIRFRPAGSSTWLNAYTPIVDRRTTVSGVANTLVRQFRGSIVGLAPGTSYEVQVTLSDADGVSGSATLSGSVSTLATTVPLGGTTWYVDDVASGGDGSSATPFNSITTAITSASAGDTIFIRQGSYPAFTISKSGTASGWIALVGENRDTTFVNGGAVTNNITVNADFVQILNLRFRQSRNNSVEVSSGRHHVWLGNLYHENVSSSQSYNDGGVVLNSGNHHVYVLDNTILSASLTSAPIVGSRWDSPGAGIHVNGSMSTEGTFVFKGNTIIGGFRDCIGNSGESLGGSTRDNTDISGNTISGCKDDAIQMEGDDVNLRIWGNDVTANNGYSAIATQASFLGPVYVYRNIVRHSWTGGAGSAFKIGGAVFTFYFHNTIETSGSAHDGFAGDRQTSGQVLRNNIIVARANPLYCMGSMNGSTYDYNLYYRASGGPIVSNWGCAGGGDYYSAAEFSSATGQERNGLSGDPQLQGTRRTISPSSPAYDRGVVLPNFNDADSAWPARGAAPDLGASEVDQAVPPSQLRIVS